MEAGKTGSVDFESEKKKFQLDEPKILKNRMDQQNLTLENIRKKMEEPGLESNFISKDVSK